MKKLLFILVFFILLGCSPRLIYTADVQLTYEDKIVSSWDSVKVFELTDTYVGFIDSGVSKFVVGNIIVINPRDSIYIK